MTVNTSLPLVAVAPLITSNCHFTAKPQIPIKIKKGQKLLFMSRKCVSVLPLGNRADILMKVDTTGNMADH